MNFEGLEKAQDPQDPTSSNFKFTDLTPWMPPAPGWHPGRMVGGAWEGLKDFARRKATFVRSHLEHTEPDEAWRREMDALNPQWRDWLLVENPELGGEVQTLIDDGTDPEIAKQIITSDFLDKRQKDQLDFIRSIEESQYLETAPEFMGQSSGTAEDVIRTLSASAGDVLGLMISPWIGIPSIYTSMHGALTEQMEQQAKISGIEIDKERIYKAASIGAAIDVPLELIGDLLQIRAITGSGPWVSHLMRIASAFMGEGATEFVQNYPETVAVTWGLNPDLTGDELLDHIENIVLSSQTARDSLYQAWVGGLAGAATGTIGQVVAGAGSRLISPKQIQIYNDKANRIKELMRNDDLDPEQQKEFLHLVGIDPEAIEDEEIAEIVERVKARLLFQAAPIESEARNQLIHQLEAGKLPQDLRELYMSVWDGMAHVAVEEGLIKNPEDFYEQWIADVRFTKEAELAEKAGREKVPPFMYQVGPVYHGTGALFEKPSTQYIGTGEGVQAFGWGLYASEAEQFAKGYAESHGDIAIKELSIKIPGRPKVSVYKDESPVDYSPRDDSPEAHAKASLIESLLVKDYQIKTWQDKGMALEWIRAGFNDAIGAYREEIEIYKKQDELFKEDLTDKDKENRKKWVKELEAKIKWLQRNIPTNEDQITFDKESYRYLYEWTLHKGKKPGEYKWLDWYETATAEEVDKVIDQILKDKPQNFLHTINILKYITPGYPKELSFKDMPATINPWVEEGSPIIAWKRKRADGKYVYAFEWLGHGWKELWPPETALGEDPDFWQTMQARGYLKNLNYKDGKWTGELEPKDAEHWYKRFIRQTTGEFYGAGKGSDIYKIISDEVFNHDYKEASLFLLRAGIDGIRYPSGTLSGIKESPYNNYVIFDENAITVEKRIAFQDRRGAVEYLFDNTPKIIHLFESADASTALHETGHILLEMMYKAGSLDYLAAAEWVGVEEDRARQGTDQWTDAEQEKFAKAFELYLLEGKAPTTRLQIVFQKLKNLLLAIYKSLANRYFSDVELNEDIRRLFDRWIATEQERLMDPVMDVSEWLKAGDLEMSEADRVKFEKQRRALNPGSVAEMEYEDLIATARKAVGAELAQRRAKMEKKLEQEFRKEAEASIADDPFYTMIDEILESGGLRRDSVATLYSKEWISELQRRRPGLISSEEGAIEPDVIAMQYGYDTADEMLQDILYRPGKQDAIDEYFDSLWRQYEATEHLNNANAYADILETEIELLNQMMGRKAPAIRRDLKKTIRAKTGQVRTPDSRKLAEDLRRDQTVAREAWAAARKAAREEFDEKLSTEKREVARREKDRALDKIAKLREDHLAKMKALRDHYKRNRETEKIHKRMGRIIRHKSMLPEFKAHILNVLGRYYRIPKTFKNRIDPPAETLEQFVEGLEAEGEQLDIIRQLLTKLPAPKTKGKLSTEDVQNIGDLVDALAHVEKLQRKQQMIDQKKAFQEVVDEAVDEIYREHKPGLAEEGPFVDKRIGFLKEMSESAKAYFAQLKKAEFIIRALDGWKDLGVNWRTLFQPIKKAEDAELTLGEEYTQKLKAAFEGFDRKWANKLYKIEGVPDPISKENMVMLMLNSGNKGNREAIKAGNGFTQEVLDEIAGKLNGREIDLVYKVWNIIDSLFPKLNEVHKKLNGVSLRKVEGKYFPLVFSRKLSWKAGEFQAQREMRDMFASAYIRPKVEAGHRIERKGGKMPVDLRFDVIANHVQNVIHDITHQVPVRNVQRVIFDPKYRSAVAAALGEDAYNQLTPWLQEVAKPRREPMSILEKWVGRLRRNATVVALGLKLTVAQKQLLSLTQTMDELGVLETLAAMQQFYRDPWALRRFVQERSPSMKHRRKAWDRELNQFYGSFNPRQWKGAEGIKETYFSLISLMDAMATYPTWLAGYNVGMKKFDGNEKQAIEYADMVVRRTQPVARAKDLADIQRGGELKKTLTMFYTFFNVFQNRMMELHGRRRSGRVNMTELVKSYWLLMIVPGILGTLINERDWDNEKIIKGLFSYSVGGMPGLRDLGQGLLSDYGYSMTPIAQFGQEISYIGKSLEAGKFEKLPKHLIYATGYLVGLPAAQITIALDGLVDMAEGKTSNPMRLLFRKKKEED